MLSRSRLQGAYVNLQALGPDQRNAARLELVLESNVFFEDTVKAIKAIAINGAPNVTTAQLYERLQASYGYRGSIPRRVRYVTQTLALFGFVSKSNSHWNVVTGPWIDRPNTAC